MMADEDNDIFKGQCRYHGERSKQIEYLEKKIAAICAWQKEHQNFADSSLKIQADRDRAMDDKIHELELDHKTAVLRTHNKILEIKSSLKTWAIVILGGLALNLILSLVNRAAT